MPSRSGPPGCSEGDADERLMEGVRRGETRAFELLFERYRARLFGFLVRRCGSAAEAEDLTQETWLRVIRARERYDRRRRFSTWLFQIANNLCRDRARRRGVERRGRASVRELARSAPPGSPGPSAELRLQVWQQLAELPDRLSEVLVLRYYQELPEREIAEIVGVPPGTVKSRLHAAVKALRDRAGAGRGR